jgi:two-component system, NarL family, sensor kinase
VMGISPPDLRRAGLAAALADLTAPLVAEGLEAEVRVPDAMDLPPDVEALLFRASREGIRNVVSHAQARHVLVTVSTNDRHVVLEVRDDGVGFSSERLSAERNGHLGLRLLGELVDDAGGTLDVTSAPNDGTVLRVEVPIP